MGGDLYLQKQGKNNIIAIQFCRRFIVLFRLVDFYIKDKHCSPPKGKESPLSSTDATLIRRSRKIPRFLTGIYEVNRFILLRNSNLIHHHHHPRMACHPLTRTFQQPHTEFIHVLLIFWWFGVGTVFKGMPYLKCKYTKWFGTSSCSSSFRWWWWNIVSRWFSFRLLQCKQTTIEFVVVILFGWKYHHEWNLTQTHHNSIKGYGQSSDDDDGGGGDP